MSKKITFTLPAEVVADATSGLLLGDFNNWDDSKAPSLKKQKDGSLKTTVTLEGGRSYQYRYLLNDGRWVNDYNAETYVHDWRYGVDNCLITVPAEEAMLATSGTETEALPKKDDLTKIEGVGKKIAEILIAAGIASFEILAKTTPKKLRAIPDETEWLKDDDAYKYKVDLLNKYKIAIWRFHDNWHAHRPDGIAMGNLIKLGWEKYYNPQTPRLLTLPQPMTIKSIAELAKKRLGISMVRVVGDLKQQCKTIYLAFGYMDPKAQIPVIQSTKPDLILSGETREWETVERVRDGLAMGQKTSLLVLSHSVSEEAGMEYLVKWLQPKVPGVRIMNIPSNNPFTFV